MATDRDVLIEMAKHSNLSDMHAITHFFYLPTQDAAEQAMHALVARDFAATRPHLALDQSWGVLVHICMVPAEEAIAALRKLFSEIAESHDGEYDGWEAELPPRDQASESGT